MVPWEVRVVMSIMHRLFTIASDRIWGRQRTIRQDEVRTGRDVRYYSRLDSMQISMMGLSK
jgi:hypothetical protein